MPQSTGQVFAPEEKLLMMPVGNRILVKPKEDPSEIGGLTIPDSAKNKYPIEGIVLDVGSEVRTIAVDDKLVPFLQPGDRVVYSKYSGVEIKVGDTRYLILNEDDIFGVLYADAPDLARRGG